MGQQQSKEELLYQQVNYGNIEGIKSLCRDGASLEWIDREGKTALIVACMKPELYDVAKTLLELGANVNYYRPGRNGGTPLHHAAKRGLEHTVKLLLSHGANPLVINDDCQTPLDVARTKALTNVVRTIESHICLFAGWMREFYGPGILEVFAPQLLSRKLWVVVYPCGSRKPTKPFKLELAMYSSLQDAQPRSVVALWKANLEEPKFYHTDTSVIIVDSSNSTKTRIKLAPGRENDKVQLQLFCNACKGIPQSMPPAFQQSSSQAAAAAAAAAGDAATAPPAAGEDMELAMAINASIESAMHEMPPPPFSMSGMMTSGGASSSSSHGKGSTDVNPTSSTSIAPPSAPPADVVTEMIQEEEVVEDGPIHYPTIDDKLELGNEGMSSTTYMGEGGAKKEEQDGGTCVICLDAPVEGACIPCGHMAGCMSCLNEIKAKKWGCPVCRAKIDQVVRLYAV